MKLVTLIAVATLSAIILRADDLSDAYDNLKRAEVAHDPLGIIKWAAETSRFARVEAALPPSQDPARAEYLKDRVVYVSQTDIYTEYSLAVAAGWPGIEPAAVIRLTETLISQKPGSEYLPLAVPPYLAALLTLGLDTQLEGATKIATLLPDNEDALLVLTDGAMQKRQSEAVMHYAAQLIGALGRKAKPAQYDEASWQQKKVRISGRAQYDFGVAACTLDLWQDCDAHLRAAQPLIGTDPAIIAPTLFYLGWSNYQLAKASGRREQMEAALNFSQQSAAIAGPVQAQARQNVSAIEQELKRK